MTIVANALIELAERKESEREIFEKAKELLAQIIFPKKITRQVIEKYMRKAMQIHAWHRLDRIDRVLLILTRRLPRVRSPVLKNVLYKIFLKIELFTTRGKALFYGIILSMQNAMHKLCELLKNVSRLLTIGLFYLNNPITYRIYG